MGDALIGAVGRSSNSCNVANIAAWLCTLLMMADGDVDEVLESEEK